MCSPIGAAIRLSLLELYGLIAVELAVDVAVGVAVGHSYGV
jgi:hypothetical protein